MEFFLFLVVLGLGIALWVVASKASRSAQRNHSLVSYLDQELQATRSALLARIDVLEGQVSKLQAGGVAGLQREPAQPEPEQEPTPEPTVAPRPTEELPVDEPTAAVPPPIEPPPFRPAPPPPPVLANEPPPVAQLSRRIDWEEWIGVKGAAVLGGIVLALAAVMFLRYAIEHELIPPVVRVAIGFATGIAAIAASERLRTRKYVTMANALAGSGIVVLYISSWAARVLYELVPSTLGFLLMILVTVACGALAWRHKAREIALLGLIGGFATPILMSTGSDNPIGLFGYVLLLDVGLIWLARVRRWPLLMALALFGTFFYEAVWILLRMGDRTEIGLGVLLLFGLFFSLAIGFRRSSEGTPEQDGMQRLVQGAGAWAPFALAFYFAGRADLGEHLYPVAALMFVLSVASAWLGRTEQMPQLPMGAAAGCLAVVMVWLMRSHFTTALAWEASAVCVALAAAFPVFLELDYQRPVEPGKVSGVWSAVITSLGFLGLLAFTAFTATGTPLWPWLFGWAVLSGLAIRQSRLSGWGLIQPPVGLALGAGFLLFYFEAKGLDSFPPEGLFFALVVLAALGLQALALRQDETPLGRSANWAAATFSITVLFLLLFESLSPNLDAWLYLAVTIVFSFLTILSATRLANGGLYFAVVALLALNHLIWVEGGFFGGGGGREEPLLAMALQLVAVITLSYWPFYAGTSLLKRRWAWYGAALAAPAWFFPLRELFEAQFGDSAIGLLPVLLGALSLGAVFKARKLGPADDPDSLRPLVWFAAIALGFVSVAIPLQLDKEWITVGWALEGLAVIVLWTRLNHPGLKYFGLALFAAVTVRLVANPELLDYHERSGWPIVNWLMYTYLIPAATLLGGMRYLRGLEVERARSWEQFMYTRRRSYGAILCAVGAVAICFTWVNLTIFDFYSVGPELTISFERMAARDLTLSLGWALYALLLLGIGFKRDSEGLRWTSLAFLVLTIGKVFLHDLGELEDLYRVASLVGLALSLMLVSLAYQRFVFSKRPPKEDT